MAFGENSGGVGSINTGTLLLLLIVVVAFIVLLAKFKAARKIFGIIFTVGGPICSIYGLMEKNSWEGQVRSYFGADSDTNMLIAAGVIILILGIILLAFSGSKTTIVNAQPIQAPPQPEIPAIKVRCTACNELNDENAKFCIGCGNPMKSSGAGTETPSP